MFNVLTQAFIAGTECTKKEKKKKRTKTKRKTNCEPNLVAPTYRSRDTPSRAKYKVARRCVSQPHHHILKEIFQLIYSTVPLRLQFIS